MIVGISNLFFTLCVLRLHYLKISFQERKEASQNMCSIKRGFESEKPGEHGTTSLCPD